jgi:hypothetical protein
LCFWQAASRDIASPSPSSLQKRESHLCRGWTYPAVASQRKIGRLSSYIYHDDRKSLSRWLWAQDQYMLIEAKKLLETPATELSFGDRIRRKNLLLPFSS